MVVLELLAAHMVGDFIFQTDGIARNKLKNKKVLLLHCFLYMLAFVPTAFYYYDYGKALLFLTAIFLAHIFVDWKRWASDKDWPPKPILVDQSLHIIALAIIVRMLE